MLTVTLKSKFNVIKVREIKYLYLILKIKIELSLPEVGSESRNRGRHIRNQEK